MAKIVVIEKINIQLFYFDLLGILTLVVLEISHKMFNFLYYIPIFISFDTEVDIFSMQ